MFLEVTRDEFIEMYEKGQVTEVVVFDSKIYGRTRRHHGDLGVESYIVWAAL